MKCGVVENPAYDFVHVQGSVGDRLEPDYNMKINPLFETSIISDEGHSHKKETPTDHVCGSVGFQLLDFNKSLRSKVIANCK